MVFQIRFPIMISADVLCPEIIFWVGYMSDFTFVLSDLRRAIQALGVLSFTPIGSVPFGAVIL